VSDKAFHKYCESAVKVLQSQFDATKVLKHNATVGSIREQIIRDFLSDHLPGLIEVVSGQIFDANNKYSKQQDIVLVMRSMPRLPFASGNDLIFRDGVVSTIEIKTNLDRAVLNSIGDNIGSVRSLKSSIGPSAQMGVTHSWPGDKILTAIVTYSGSNLVTYLDDLASLDECNKPDLLLDLSQGLLIRNHGLLVRKEENLEYILHGSPAGGFTLFLTFLTEITSTLSARGVKWRNYL